MWFLRFNFVQHAAPHRRGLQSFFILRANARLLGLLAAIARGGKFKYHGSRGVLHRLAVCKDEQRRG